MLEAGPFSASNGEGRVLFEGASIRLPAARLTALEGASGSGKTTLLRLLVGLDPAPAASRRLEGKDLTGSSICAWRARITLLAQDAPILPGTVRDNLEFPFRQRAAAGRLFDQAAAREALREVGLGDIPFDRDATTLSGGERHRLALVRGLLWDPPVLVADEPLSGIDETTAMRCFETLAAFARRPGRAVLAVFHDSEMSGRADSCWCLTPSGLEESR